MTALDELLDAIFDGKRAVLRADFEGWARGSRRYRAFAETFRVKIRAKLKNVIDDGGMQDLREELATAALLLREDRFTLDYEKYASSKRRGPDFTVTFKTHTSFNVEVRRLRGAELDVWDPEARTGKLMDVLCDKAGQMPAAIVNLLWLTAERGLSEPDLTRAAVTLRNLAERKVDDFFTHRGFESAVGFLKQYRHLSGIVLHKPDSSVFWLNSLAAFKVPPDIVRAIQRLEMPPASVRSEHSPLT